MKKKKYLGKVVLLGVLFLLGAMSFPAKKVQAESQNGFVKENGQTYYYENGEICKRGFVTIQGKTYYFSKKTGAMLTGWAQSAAGNRRYFDKETGEMLTGWAKDSRGRKRYFSRGAGIMARGWLENSKGQKRYFNKNTGIMYTKWVKNPKGQYRYFSSGSGILLTGWQKNQAGKIRYFTSGTGIMLTGWQSDQKGQKRYFDQRTGIMFTGVQNVEGVRYYFGNNGVMQKENSKIVGIDPGHQSSWQNIGEEPIGPGAGETKRKIVAGTQGDYTGMPEYQLNLDVALKLRTELEKRGYTVVMTRTTNDVLLSNVERAQRINSSGADICVRIHADSGPHSAHGAGAFYPSANNPYVSRLSAESRRLSETLLGEYCNATGLYNRGGTASDSYTGCNWSTVPVTILELGFMSNANDDWYMSSELGQQQMVIGIANGIDAYFEQE